MIGEAAQILGISPTSLKKLVKQGVIPAYRIKGIMGLRFKRSEVLDLIEKVDPAEVGIDDNE